jgi:prepilin-type N-terminal cleavage/methylation domain-containing protein
MKPEASEASLAGRAVRRGFTLIEILIVVVLLAVLAAIVVPSFSTAASSSRKTALTEQLRRIRTDIQLYKIQHQDQPPTLAGAPTDWSDLTQQKPNATGTLCGPYMTSQPKNPLNNFSDVHVVAADPTWGDAVPGANIGFVYNSSTGYMWGTNTAGDMVFNEDNIDDPNN